MEAQGPAFCPGSSVVLMWASCSPKKYEGQEITRPEPQLQSPPAALSSPGRGRGQVAALAPLGAPATAGSESSLPRARRGDGLSNGRELS